MRQAAKVSEESGIGLGEEAKAFLDRFGSHLLIRSFDGMNAMQLEDLAGEISNESNELMGLKPEDVEKIPLEHHREMHDQRWLSTFAWCWAANAYAAGQNGEKFDEMIENAIKEFPRIPYFEQGKFLEDIKKTKEVIGKVSKGAVNEMFNFIVNVISQSTEDVSLINCGYYVGASRVMYGPGTQYDFMRRGIKYALDEAKNLGLVVPAGRKERAIIDALANVAAEKTPAGNTIVAKVGSTLSGLKSKATGESKVVAARKAGIERQRQAYHPSDDAQIRESEAGRVRFGFMGYEFGAYDMLVPGNRMRFETRRMRLAASNTAEEVRFARKDLSLPEGNYLDTRSYFENLVPGNAPGGYDNDNVMWVTSEAGVITQHPGAYRKNALGVFVAKRK